MTEPYFEELDALYRRVLGRPIDPSGYETYAAVLQQGESSLEDIEEILRSSQELTLREAARERALRFLIESRERVRDQKRLSSGLGRSASRHDGLQSCAPTSLSVRTILLERDPQRAAHVHGNLVLDLAGQGVTESHIVPAVDGGGPEGIGEICRQLGGDSNKDPTRASPFMYRKLGCALSHARAWATIGDQPALVLEDDAVVSGKLLQKAVAIVDYVNETHSGWHIVYLYTPCAHPALNGDPVFPYCDDCDNHHGNVGYLISPEGRDSLVLLLKEKITALDTHELEKLAKETHFALDHSIMQWVRSGDIQAFWATERLVETIGQVGRQQQAVYFRSNIFPQG